MINWPLQTSWQLAETTVPPLEATVPRGFHPPRRHALAWIATSAGSTIRFQAVAVIAHRQLDSILTDQDRHRAVRPRAVSYSVRHGLDHDPVGGGLDRRGSGQATRTCRSLPTRQSRRPGARCSDKTELVKRRRTQILNEPSYVREARRHLGVDLAEQAHEPPTPAAWRAASPALSRIAASVGPNPSWRSRRSRRRSSSRNATTSARDRNRSWCRRTAWTAGPTSRARANELQIGRFERVVAATLGHPQPTDCGTVVREGLGVHGAHRHTLFGSHVKLTRPVGKVDRDVRQAQRLGNGFNHHGQHIVRHMTACIRVPRRASTPAGSSRSPYISRFTVRCAALRSGASARARRLQRSQRRRFRTGEAR